MRRYQKLVIIAVLAMVALGIAVGATVIIPPSVTPSPTPTPTPTPIPDGSVTPTPTPTPQKTYILYFVSQPNCPYCSQMHPLVVAWAATHKNVELRELQTGSDVGNSFNVRSAPTTILVDKSTGKEVTRFVGVFDTNDLNKYVS